MCFSLFSTIASKTAQTIDQLNALVYVFLSFVFFSSSLFFFSVITVVTLIITIRALTRTVEKQARRSYNISK